MQIKVLFLDDIFSESFRTANAGEQVAFDDAWADAIEKELTNNTLENVRIDVVRSGDIDSWRQLIETAKPDIVLLDLYCYEQSKAKYSDVRQAMKVGLDALKAIRGAFPELPIIQYTVKPDRQTMDLCYAAGASFFLEKVPLALPEVHSSLKYIMIHLVRKQRNQ